jgi:small subunit ribosomal protein S17
VTENVAEMETSVETKAGEKTARVRSGKKEFVGMVKSDKMEKTIVVEVTDHKAHSKYKKIMKTTKKYKARDENNVCKIGDIVNIIESRPLAGTVHWALSDIVTKAK